MSKIYLLEKIFSSEFDGNSITPIIVSTNKQQMQKLLNDFKEISGAYTTYVCKMVFQYKPKKSKNLKVIMHNDGDEFTCCIDILAVYFDLKKSESMVQAQIDFKSKSEDGSVYAESLVINNSLTKKQMHHVLKNENDFYQEKLDLIKKKKTAKYWSECFIA